MVAIEKVQYGGWDNVYRLHNGVVEVFVTADVGPRVIRFGFIGQANEFREVPEHLGKTGGDMWRSYGGHRLWHAPERSGRTNYPDNNPVTVTSQGSTLHAVAPIEARTGMQKEMEITLDDSGTHVHVLHRIRNHNLWPVEFAPWAVTVMAAGGVGILPQPIKGTHPANLLPTSKLALWAYTNMADPRWTWGEKFILLRQDTSATVPQKVGLGVTQGWTGYAHDGHLFVKAVTYQPGASYPDLGSSVELFTNTVMLEVETLGPVVMLDSGEEVTHFEDWYLFDDVPMPTNDAGVEQHIVPKIQAIKG